MDMDGVPAARRWRALPTLRPPRSIVGWFVLCWATFLVGALAVGTLLSSLYLQTTSERLRRAEAAVAHGCDAIADRYRFLVAGPATAPVPELGDPAVRQALAGAVTLALAGIEGVEGGIWDRAAGPVAYAYPTYAGAAEKTDVPAAERTRIAAAAEAAVAAGAPVARHYDGSGSQRLFLHACPLQPNPVAGLAAWTMTRVTTAGGGAFLQAIVGLAILLAVLAGSAALLGRMLLGWSRRLRRLEEALAGADAELPRLEPTGQHDLDRIVAAVNRAGERLAAARAEAERLTRRVAEAERLAGLGRVAAGVAHEIRNPIAAIRLKAENALAADPASGRRERALEVILGQVARLDLLTRDLLTSVQRTAPEPAPTDVEALLAERAELFGEQARAAGVALTAAPAPRLRAILDAGRIGRALDNLILNALQSTPAGGRVVLAAELAGEHLLLSVADDGHGVPAAVRAHLFEPFVTARPEGTGLGLAIVREIVEAHGGTARVLHRCDGTTFTLELPWRPC
ncbi:MAG: ATP-binding protein [Geminicoccaceae bacterium]